MTDGKRRSVTPRRSSGGRGRARPPVAGPRPETPGLESLVERGKERGYVTEDEIDTLFEDADEPPDTAEVEGVHQYLLDQKIEVVTDEAELLAVQEDVQTEAQLDRLEEAGQPIQTDPVWQYLKDIHDIPLIKAEQEVDLAQRIEQGDSEALQQFTLANLRLVATSPSATPGEASP